MTAFLLHSGALKKEGMETAQAAVSGAAGRVKYLMSLSLLG